MLRAVTFDCAETLLRVRWSPGHFAADCARAVGLSTDNAHLQTYQAILASQWNDYEKLNESKDPQICDEWWRSLTLDWLVRIGESEKFLEPLMMKSQELLYTVPNPYFEVFDDVVECLEILQSKGLRLAVLSNWDYSLHRMLDAHGLSHWFESTIASLEEGAEKPDARLFQLAADRLSTEPYRILHVGDNPIDDVEGGRGAGFQTVLLLRGLVQTDSNTIGSLRELPAWIDEHFPS